MNFIIYNWNCYVNESQKMVLSVGADNGIVLTTLGKAPADTQKWMLEPNFVANASVAAGGFTLRNVAGNQAIYQPVKPGQQLGLGDDPTPYGQAEYCWTVFSVSFDTNTGLETWAIQSYSRGAAMDAHGGKCDADTPVYFWDWNAGGNQKWVIEKIDL